jgi:hypothetical protein
VDHLAAFARQRLAEEIVATTQQLFAFLHGRLGERLRDLAFCRQRLRHLQESLESSSVDGEEMGVTRYGPDTTLSSTPLPSTESYWEVIRQSATAHVVLPEDEEELERAAVRFLGGIKADQWIQLDQFLQDRVLAPLGGLHNACKGCSDLARHLAAPLVDQAAGCLGEHLPVMDVAEVQTPTANGAVETQVRECFERATPLLAGSDAANQQALLLVPASDAGKQFGERAREALGELRVVRVPGQADLMFCREKGFLTINDLQHLLRPCRSAYEALAGAPHSSPHCRCDIVDWVPLDP